MADDFQFDADGYEAEVFVGEVVRAEKGNFPVKKRDPNTKQLVSVLVPAIQVETENLTRDMPFNWVETFEDKRGSKNKLTEFMRACQALGIKSLSQYAQNKYYEFERKRISRGTGQDGNEIVMIVNLPRKILSAAEAAEVKKNRGAQPIEESGFVEETTTAPAAPQELSYQEAYILSLMANLSPKALIAQAEDDPVVSKDAAFMEAVKTGTIQQKLEAMGKVAVVEGKYKVSQ